MTRIERLLVSAGLGAGATSLAMLGLGLAGLWQPEFLRGIFYAGVVVCLGLALLDARRRRGHDGAESDRPDPVPVRPGRPGALAGAAFGLIVLAIVMNVLATAAPETFYDALVYHLGLPKLYLLRGRIAPTPESLYSGFPFGMEMLYGLMLALADENLASLLHCSFGVITALAVWAFLRRQASSSAGVLGALLYYLCPLVLYGSWQCGIDVGAGFYLMLALITLSFCLKNDAESRSIAWPVATGILLGFAMGVKYTLLPMAAVFILVFFWLRRRTGPASCARETAWLTVSAAAVFLPWLIKDLFFYGNPFYPFFNRSIGWTAPADWKGFLGDAHSRDLARTFGSLAGWKEFLVQPWAISVQSRTLDDWPGLSYLLFVPWAILLRWGILKKERSGPPIWTAVLALAAAGYLIWSLTSGMARFLAMVLPFAACLASLTISCAPLPGWLRQAAWIIAILSGMYSFQVTCKMGMAFASGRWSAVTGRISRDDYLGNGRMAYPAPPYNSLSYINQRLPRDAKILFLGEERGFYCERDFIAATVFDDNPFWAAARGAKTPEELLAKVRQAGVTHVLVNAAALCAHSGRRTVLPADVVAGKVFEDFWDRYLEIVFEDHKRAADGSLLGRLIVYRLRDTADGDPRTFPENVVKEALANCRGES